MPPHPLGYLRTHRGFEIAPAMGAPTGGANFYQRESWFIVLNPNATQGATTGSVHMHSPLRGNRFIILTSCAIRCTAPCFPWGGEGVRAPIHRLEEYCIPQTVNARKPYQKIKVSYDFPSSFTMSSLGFLSKDKGFLRFLPFFVHVHAPHTYQRLKVS